MLELLSEVYSKQQCVRKIVEDSNFCSNKIELTLLYFTFVSSDTDVFWKEKHLS